VRKLARALSVGTTILALGLVDGGIALACPACAARTGPGAAVFTWIALMIAVPYVIVAITIRTIRKLERET
jgi:hypothetical protein